MGVVLMRQMSHNFNLITRDCLEKQRYLGDISFMHKKPLWGLLSSLIVPFGIFKPLNALMGTIMAQVKLFVALSHTLTDAQIQGFKNQFGGSHIATLKEVAPELHAKMIQIDPSATLVEIQKLAKLIVAEAVKAEATHFCLQGEPALMMWANLFAGIMSDSHRPSNKRSMEFSGKPERVDFPQMGEIWYKTWGDYDEVFTNNLVCIQSTTERKSVETINEDGTVVKMAVFEHVQWREMF